MEHRGERGRLWVGFAQWCCATQHRCSFPPPSSCQQSRSRALIQGREAAVIMKLWPEGLAPPALLLHSLQPSSSHCWLSPASSRDPCPGLGALGAAPSQWQVVSQSPNLLLQTRAMAAVPSRTSSNTSN